MKEHRHPHPHRDPRQPRNQAKPGTTPPVFAWKPLDGQPSYHLQVARDAGFTDLCLDVDGLTDSVHLPEKALAPGRYFWRWSAGPAKSEVFTFEITSSAVTLEVPPVAEWLQRLPKDHPRIYIRPEDIGALRESRTGARAALWDDLRAQADAFLAEPHELAEPPFLPDWSKDYHEAFAAWYRILRESRKFTRGAEALALTYLADGDAKYARAACQRMASVSRWDPTGSTNLAHNDEAHMSITWHGPLACDWAWDRFTDEERARVIDQFRRRGQMVYDRMHGQGAYGVSRFDSHAGREIVFLALIAFAFHDHIPQAAAWLEWLRPVLCGVWPIWAGDDGAWAEGPSYSLSYVSIMTMFATALKRGTGVDLYQRPFWKNHAQWRVACFPPYAEWIGFGDNSERAEGNWRSHAALVETIDRETRANACGDYVGALRAEADRMADKAAPPDMPSQRYLASLAPAQVKRPPEPNLLRVFPAAGWAALRTNPDDPAQDIALIFRSSPYGAISHSHANQNDFILHAAGKVLAMPSGYYDGYGSDHHYHWIWHTKSHNCVTLSDASQLMRSHDSLGAVGNAFEDERLAYLRGNADAAYQDRASRCRRHLLFLKPHACFVLIDEFVADPLVASALQWNIHSWSAFTVDEAARAFSLEREGSILKGHFLYHKNAFFSLTEGWDPPMIKEKDDSRWFSQRHLRFTTSGLAPRRNLGVVLCPGHAALAPAQVRAERSGEAEVARIGDDIVMVNQADTMEYNNLRTDALALLVVQGQRYEIRDGGIALTPAG